MDQPSPQYDLAPAPYGRACMNCSQSKCKCILPKGGGRCQRCQRLNKECRPSAFHRRPNVRKSSKSGRLERKLDDLVTLLRAQSSAGLPGDYVELVEDLRREPEAQQALPQIRVERTVSSVERGIDCGFLAASAPRPAPDFRSEVHARGQTSPEPTPSQAEECLSVFVTHKLPYLPLVYLPPGTTAQRLRRERPFLWLCIMAVASKSPSQRHALCDKIRDTVAQRMVHDYAGRDVDFLLGLLVFMAWSNQQIFKKLNLTVYNQFAKSVVFDLMLNKPPEGDGASLMCLLQTQPDENPSPPPVRTMEERRAVLGCFLLTSIISLFLQKCDTLRWTPHMDDCLQHLSEHPECLNDEVLAQQVRFQLVNEKINTGDWHTGLTSTHEPLKAPMTLYLHAINSQFKRAQSKLAPHSQRYRILHLHHNNTILTLNETSLLKPPTPTPHALNFQQLESLHTCLEAVNSWMGIFLAIPPAEYASFPFPVFAQLARNLAALYKLSTLEDPAWDRGHVRRIMDIMTVMDRLIGNLGQAAALAKLESGEEGEDVFFYSIGKYESVRMSWGLRFDGGGSTGGGGRDGAGMGMEQAVQQHQHQDMPGHDLGMAMGFDDCLSEFLNSMMQ
ncbi:hypothetical protein BO78DRAFT_426933 [Aspergillus sclerotiicarbonarius CBS 121057]|uniref:Zn(2)-C6 fungal-type domain-containing protein n=1 Tax=Aspergillus sclerotiicarbonarius (strain CBS 121057 / IBT 28362) TaxID=1448318 RepID=A0A319ESF8_ASPSB|nr:hypothetical protein BO78DRAFT_426933 [Aspergillus sclerotiicarbonarius CBS 121057]